MAEKIVIYEVKLMVSNHNSGHIKKFERALQKLVNTSGMNHTELAQVKEVKK